MPNKGIIMLNGRQYGDSGTNYNVVKCTQQEYDAMTPEQKNNGCLYIVLGSTTNSVNYLGATVVGNTNQASGVSYDDSQTQLGATNVQDAIGRINADLTVSVLINESGIVLTKVGNVYILNVYKNPITYSSNTNIILHTLPANLHPTREFFSTCVGWAQNSYINGEGTLWITTAGEVAVKMSGSATSGRIAGQIVFTLE